MNNVLDFIHVKRKNCHLSKFLKEKEKSTLNCDLVQLAAFRRWRTFSKFLLTNSVLYRKNTSLAVIRQKSICQEVCMFWVAEGEEKIARHAFIIPNASVSWRPASTEQEVPAERFNNQQRKNQQGRAQFVGRCSVSFLRFEEQEHPANFPCSFSVLASVRRPVNRPGGRSHCVLF